MKDFEFTATHVPIDMTARKVVSKGINFDKNEFVSKHKFKYHSDLPLIINNQLPKDPSFIDFTGLKVGNLSVIGLVKNSYGIRGKWLVKCNCGIYEVRTSKAIKNHLNNPQFDNDCCLECEEKIKLTRIAEAKSQYMDYKEYCETRYKR